MKRQLFLGSVSAIALTLGMTVSGAAEAQQIVPQPQSGATAEINYGGGTVVGNRASDYGSTRDNTEDNSHNQAVGVTHVQQNNGSSNELGIASAVQANVVGGGLVGTFAGVSAATARNFTAHHGGTRTNDILDSFNDYSGVAAVQQNNGDNNSMGIANAIHGNSGGPSAVSQSAMVLGTTFGQIGDGEFGVVGINSVAIDGEGALLDDGSTRINTIDPSFQGASGVVSVQQNNGNGNAMGIANSVVTNTGDGVVAQNAATSGKIQEQRTIDAGLDRDNLITDGSFNGAHGVMNVQQNNGDANVMSIANAVAANSGEGLGDPLGNDVKQSVNVKGSVAGAIAFDDDENFADGNAGQRQNLIDSSFDNAEGVLNVQQNNGSNNVMGIANAVQANLDTGPVTSLDGSDDVSQVTMVVGGTVRNVAVQRGTPLTPPPSHRENLISNSFTNAAGITNVQQNNGDNNVIGSGNAVIANLNSGDKTDNVLTSRASTQGETSGNQAYENDFFKALVGSGANRDNAINPSFNGFHGMATVQQNNGNNNVIGSSTAVVANRNNESDTSAEAASNAATGFAAVGKNTAMDHTNTDRVNTIDSSFENAAGIMTVQQNNGDNNVIGASTAVTADLDNGAAAGFGPAASLAALGSTVTGNTTIVTATSTDPGYQNTITGSFNGASGIMTVQQNNGSNNAIQSAVAATVNVSTVN